MAQPKVPRAQMAPGRSRRPMAPRPLAASPYALCDIEPWAEQRRCRRRAFGYGRGDPLEPDQGTRLDRRWRTFVVASGCAALRLLAQGRIRAPQTTGGRPLLPTSLKAAT